MTQHRRPEIRFSDAPRGQCRLCVEPIEYDAAGPKAGQIDRRRRWHPDCVDTYNESDPSEARRRVRKRDRGRCSACKVDTYAVRREIRRIGRGRVRETRKRGYKPGRSFWELDHIVPLIDGGGHGDDNLQTLCTPCHVRKTAVEARERAARRRCGGVESLESPTGTGTTCGPGKSMEAQALGVDPPRGRDRRVKTANLDDLLSAADAVNERAQRALEEWPLR